MNHVIDEIEAALATVEKTIDRLRALGHEDLAFGLARLQFSSAIRASWPGNLAPLAVELGKVADDTSLAFTPDERARLESAVATFRRLCQF